MLEKPAVPAGVAQWCQRLDERPLPVMPDSIAALNKALKQPDIALHELGNLMAADPIMTLHLLRECQRQFGERVEGSLSNVHHCVAMLGLDRTLVLARTFTVVPEPLTSQLHYLESLGGALHSAELARHWLSQRQPAGGDQVYLAALLLGIVDAALWLFAGREMQALFTLTEREAIPADEADMAVLGCTRAQIGAALASHWHFPAAIADAIAPPALTPPTYLLRQARRAQRNHSNQLPNRDSQGQLIRNNGLYVQLAHWMAHAARHSWYSAPVRRCYLVLAACLFTSPAEVRELTYDCTLKLSRQWPVPLISAPACGLLWPSRPRPRRRIKPIQLPQVVRRLLAVKSPDTVASTDTFSPARSRPHPAHQAVRQREQPAKIGLTSHNLPQDLDRSGILNAPLPAVQQTEAPRFPGFKSMEKKQTFDQFIQSLLSEPSVFKTENDVIRAVVEHLHDCTELERVVAALHNVKQDQIEGSFALGCDLYPGLKRYRVRLQPANLFTHLMKQPAGVWLSPDRPNKATGLIPGSFKQASQSDNYFLMSIFNHQGSVAMIYADRGLSDRLGLSEHEYAIFKTACSTCSRHLMMRGRQAIPPSPD